MPKLINVLEWFALVLWLGATYTISLLVLPRAFSVLPHPFSGDMAGALFPPYFLVSGIGLALIMLIHATRDPWKDATQKTLTILLLVMALALACNTLWFAPKVSALRVDIELHAEQFRYWHGLSMIANLVVMIGGLPLIALTALRKSDSSSR